MGGSLENRMARMKGLCPLPRGFGLADLSRKCCWMFSQVTRPSEVVRYGFTVFLSRSVNNFWQFWILLQKLPEIRSCFNLSGLLGSGSHRYRESGGYQIGVVSREGRLRIVEEHLKMWCPLSGAVITNEHKRKGNARSNQ